MRTFSPVALAALLAGAASLVPLHARAQEGTPPPPDVSSLVGKTVRVTAPGTERPVAGRLESVRGDTLRLSLRGGGTAQVLAGQVTRLEVRERGERTQRNVGALGILGALVGGGVYLAVCGDARGECGEVDTLADDGSGHDHAHGQDDSLTGGVLAVMGGALLGGALGYVLTPAEWRSVDAPLRVSVGAGATGGVALGAAIRTR